MLKLSKILTTPGHLAVIQLLNQANTSEIDETHVETISIGSPLPTQSVRVKALTVSTNGIMGRYNQEQTVNYERPLVSRLLPGTPLFYLKVDFPLTFKTLREYLAELFGLILEPMDIAQYKNSTEYMTDNFVFNLTYPHIMDNTLELYVHPKSLRFCPSEAPSFKFKLVTANGTEIDLLNPTVGLNPLTSLDP